MLYRFFTMDRLLSNPNVSIPASFIRSSRPRTPFKKGVYYNLEPRQPHVALTQRKYAAFSEEYRRSKTAPEFLSGEQRRKYKYPKRGDLQKPFHVKPKYKYDYLDSAEKPIYQELVKLKQLWLLQKLVCFKYWLPHPRNVDKEILDEKLITYILNPTHRADNPQGSSGEDKFKLICKHMGLQNNAESANQLYYWLMHELLNCENTLMKIRRTDHAVRATYMSPFISKDDSHLYVFIHVWRSRYFKPDEEDLEVLRKKSLPCDTETAYIDGHSSFVTGYVKRVEKLLSGGL